MSGDDSRRVDKDGRRFLRAVEYFGGEATMTEIRSRTGLSRDAANHRFRRLEELGLIEVGYASEGYGDREPPKVARLTGTARREIERGLFAPLRRADGEDRETIDLKSEVQSLQSQVETHENRLDTLSAHEPDDGNIKARLDGLEARLDELQEYVFGWDETAETHLRAIQAAMEEEGLEIEAYLQEAAAEYEKKES